MTTVWAPSTAYAQYAAIIPTAFTGYMWRCTTAGTSDVSEPAWPADPSVTPTVADGTVVWTVGSGFRQEIQAGVYAICTQFQTANPGLLRSVRTVRPRSLTTAELPCLFVGDMPEQVVTMNGLRQRMFRISVYLVDFMGEQIESNDRMNFAADAFADWWTQNYHASGGKAIFTHTATNDSEFAEGPAVYPALEFVIETAVQEGRT